jgi:hypothetical protein
MLVGAGRLMKRSGGNAAGILRPGVLRSPLVLSRTHLGGEWATALSSDGVSWSLFPGDALRFSGAARRLLVGGQRTELIRNPRFEGATLGVIGAGGVAPTHMTLTPGANQTVEIIAIGTVQGLPCIELEIVAIAASSGTFSIEAGSSIPLAASTTYTASGFCQITGGSLTNVALFALRGRTDAVVAVNGPQASFSGASATEMTRAVAAPFTTAADATLGRVQLLFNTSGAATTRFRLAAPQFEVGGFASSPILPAVGTPAASTRGADLLSATLSALGVGANGACTVLGTFMLPQNAPAGNAQSLLEIDAGSILNRYLVRNDAGTAGLNLYRVTAGAGALAAGGSITAGTAFRLGISVDGAGRAAASLNGAAAVAVTGGPTSGLTTLRIGANAIGTENMFGEVGSLRVLPYVLSDADLATQVGALRL